MSEIGARNGPGVVAITGGSSGNGRAAALLFARRGWRVGLIARNPDTLAEARAEIEAAGGTACTAPADVADLAALQAAADAIEVALGPIDVWVNNAGAGIFGPFLRVPEEEFRRLTEVNYLGTVNGTRVALSSMAVRGTGTVVQVVSAIGFRGVPLQSAYSGAKWAIRGFTEAIRAELITERSAVRVAMVFPPSVNTPFFEHAVSHMPQAVRPPPPMYQPEVIAEAILRAATTGQREVRVSSTTWSVAALSAVAPGLVDQLAGRLAPGSQQSRKPVVTDPNLFAPGGTAATRGRFGAESRGFSMQMMASRNPLASVLAAGAALGLGAGLVAMAALSRPRR